MSHTLTKYCLYLNNIIKIKTIYQAFELRKNLKIQTPHIKLVQFRIVEIWIFVNNLKHLDK